MPIFYPDILQERTEPRTFSYVEKDAILYALGVGMGADPLDEKELDFLFEERKIGRVPSPDALKIEGVEAGYEVVPTDEAKALAAYLASLRADVPLFEAPMTAK